MEWRDVDSSAISRVGYDAASMTLGVEWRAAGIYHYFDVNEVTFQQLVSAPSVGAFVSTVIKPLHRYSKQ